MANFTYFIRERVKLNGIERGTNIEVRIPGINHSDSRIMNIPSGSITEIINVENLPGAGQFVSSSIKYARISNLSTGSINLEISGSTSKMNYLISGSGSFMFSTEFVNETFNSFTYGDLKSIKASPLDPNATVGYFIALT
jgi:hypothetical protein|tara:strand:+ start:151 stop:570 length:420 start_codon:yes stop_codon:yes gene_type:complete